MVTIKSYTDLKQSKKLAEILPPESADMCYLKREINNTFIETPIIKPIGGVEKSLYCWSFVALFDILPILDNRSPVVSKTFYGKYIVVYHSTAYEKAILTSDYDNPVDACVAMVEKLHELNLL